MLNHSHITVHAKTTLAYFTQSQGNFQTIFLIDT